MSLYASTLGKKFNFFDLGGKNGEICFEIYGLVLTSSRVPVGEFWCLEGVLCRRFFKLSFE
jgi:hypothetical protein